MTKTLSVPAFSLDGLAAADTAELKIRHPITGETTGWTWIIAGPGHPQTISHADKMQRRRLNEERLKEQARVNGKRWKGDDRDPDEIRADTVAGIVARVIAFDPVVLAGAEIAFSPEACARLLSDPAYGWLLSQVIEFLTEDTAFFPASPKT